MVGRLLAWLDSRTGYRSLVKLALDEELPPGTGWTFTTGSVVTMLVGCQFVTGLGLAMYYVPAPSLAYDSVRFIMQDLPIGWLVRGLHYWGASFLVVAAVIHLLRVFLLGSYKAPREVTWLSGVLMLLVILAFALTGYLLPWDQKGYWATTVTINIARSSPLAGEFRAQQAEHRFFAERGINLGLFRGGGAVFHRRRTVRRHGGQGLAAAEEDKSKEQRGRSIHIGRGRLTCGRIIMTQAFGQT